MDAWGTPLEYEDFDDYEFSVRYCSYDGIDLMFYTNGRNIDYIDVMPDHCTYNGASLNKNRSALIEILGAPTNEGWENYDYDYETNEFIQIYCMSYDNICAGLNVTIYMMSPYDTPERISIS